MKASLKTTFTMVMEDTFIPMAITIQECGKMAKDQVGESWLIRVVRYTRECGSTVNSLAIDQNTINLV